MFPSYGRRHAARSIERFGVRPVRASFLAITLVDQARGREEHEMELGHSARIRLPTWGRTRWNFFVGPACWTLPPDGRTAWNASVQVFDHPSCLGGVEERFKVSRLILSQRGCKEERKYFTTPGTANQQRGCCRDRCKPRRVFCRDANGHPCPQGRCITAGTFDGLLEQAKLLIWALRHTPQRLSTTKVIAISAFLFQSALAGSLWNRCAISESAKEGVAGLKMAGGDGSERGHMMRPIWTCLKHKEDGGCVKMVTGLLAVDS